MRPAETAAAARAPIPMPDPDALPWMRLVTGLVALAILALPAGRHVGEATVRPIADRVITVAALPPLPPAGAQLAGEDDLAPESTLAADRAERPNARARPALLTAPAATQLRTRQSGRSWRGFAGARHAAARGARARHAPTRVRLTRAQVVREYIASREQVAALTREDSGSAWLTRAAARRRAAGPRPRAAARRS